MDKKYKVTQEFMNELIKWKKDRHLGIVLNVTTELLELPAMVRYWQTKPTNFTKCNNRLIAIIQWLNGEDMFEVEGQNKFVVRSEDTDQDGHYGYVAAVQSGISYNRHYIYEATKFDTQEEAQEWANSHQVIVEIDAEGNEVK